MLIFNVVSYIMLFRGDEGFFLATTLTSPQKCISIVSSRG